MLLLAFLNLCDEGMDIIHWKEKQIMGQPVEYPRDIVTVPHVEIDEVDPLTAAFGALAEEDGDPDRMIGRRTMIVDMVSTVRLFAACDEDMVEPILVFEIPPRGMTMGMIEDLCMIAIGHHAARFNASPPPAHDAWDFRRELDAVHLRPSYDPE